jgi:hypothetical protein
MSERERWIRAVNEAADLVRRYCCRERDIAIADAFRDAVFSLAGVEGGERYPPSRTHPNTPA